MHCFNTVVHTIGRRPKLVPLTLRRSVFLVSVPLKVRGWHVGAIVMKAVRQVDAVFMERVVELQLVKPDLVANATRFGAPKRSTWRVVCFRMRAERALLTRLALKA